jgi:hypothetical protein
VLNWWKIFLVRLGRASIREVRGRRPSAAACRFWLDLSHSRSIRVYGSVQHRTVLQQALANRFATDLTRIREI